MAGFDSEVRRERCICPFLATLLASLRALDGVKLHLYVQGQEVKVYEMDTALAQWALALQVVDSSR